MWETADLSTVITSLPKLNHQQENWFSRYAGGERAHCTFPVESASRRRSLSALEEVELDKTRRRVAPRGWNEVVSHFKYVFVANEYSISN